MAKKRGRRQIYVNVYKYVKENLRKGHSLKKIKIWLIKYGYDPVFVTKFIKGFRAKQIAKRVVLSSFVVFIALFFVSLSFFNPNITGAVVVNNDNEKGCCIDREGICREGFPRKYCNYEGVMFIPHSCYDLSYCNAEP